MDLTQQPQVNETPPYTFNFPTKYQSAFLSTTQYLSMASTQRGLVVPELLENILLHVPERELLLSQRVNQNFRNVIKHSPKLQRKLFYTADHYLEGNELSELKWNPLLKFLCPHLEGTSERILYATWQRWRQANHNNLLSPNDFVRALSLGLPIYQC